MARPIEIKPSMGGRLMTNLSAENVGAANWTIKRDVRRNNDTERRAEGYDLFAPNPANAPQPPTGDAVTLVALARQPNGRTAVVVGTKSKLFRYFGLENGNYCDPDYCDPTYFDNNPGAWITIGSGFSRKGHRWEAESINGYLVLNNGVDLPMTYRVEEIAVKPIYELREEGVSSVRTIADHDGILHCGGLSILHDDTLKSLIYPIPLNDTGASNGSVAINFTDDILTPCSLAVAARATNDVTKATATLAAAQNVYDTAETALATAKAALTAAQSQDSSGLAQALMSAQTALSEDPDNQTLQAAIAAAQEAQSVQPDTAAAKTAVDQAQASFDLAKASLSLAKETLSEAQSTLSAANARGDVVGLKDWVAADPTRLIGMRLIWDSGDVRTILGLTGPANNPTALVIDNPQKNTLDVAGNVTGTVGIDVPDGPVKLENPMAYAAFTEKSQIDDVLYRVAWSLPSEPRRFGSSIPVTLDTSKDYLSLDYPAKSLSSGMDLTIPGANSDGGNLTFTAGLVNASTVVAFNQAFTTVRKTVNAARQSAQDEQLEADAALASAKHSANTAASALATAKQNLTDSTANYAALKQALDDATNAKQDAESASELAITNYNAAQTQLVTDQAILAANPGNATDQQNVTNDQANVAITLTAMVSAQAAVQSANVNYQNAINAIPNYGSLSAAVAAASLQVQSANAAVISAQTRVTGALVVLAKLNQQLLPTSSVVKASDTVNSITGKFEDLQGDGSGILKMKKLRAYLLVYTETSIFAGKFTGNTDQPYLFDQIEIPEGMALRYPNTLFSVPGGGIYGSGAFHIYAGANAFYRFDIYNQVPQELPNFEDCKNVFFENVTVAPIIGDELIPANAVFNGGGTYTVNTTAGWTYQLTDPSGNVTQVDATGASITITGTADEVVGSCRPVVEQSASDRIFAVNNTITKEAFICFPSSTLDAALRFDYRYGTVSTTSAGFTAAEMVIRPESATQVGKAEEWFVMGNASGQVLRYGLVNDQIIRPPAGVTVSKSSNSATVTASGDFFTARMVGRSIITSTTGKVFAISVYINPTSVTVIGAGAAVAEAFVVDPAIYHRNGNAYQSVLQSGLESYGNADSAKTFTRYAMILSSKAIGSAAGITFFGGLNPRAAADMLNTTINSPDYHNFIPLVALAYYFGDRITVDGINNPFELSSRIFDVDGAKTKSFERA